MAAASSLAVELHNEYRKRHGAPPVQLDMKLCELAEAYATSLANGQRTNEPDSNIGRNVLHTRIAGSATRNRRPVDPTEVIREAVTSWYGHIEEYNWEAPLSSPQHARSFAAVVWADSQLIGVGVVTRGVVTVVVVLYYPVGCVMSEDSYKLNVLRPR